MERATSVDFTASLVRTTNVPFFRGNLGVQGANFNSSAPEAAPSLVKYNLKQKKALMSREERIIADKKRSQEIRKEQRKKSTSSKSSNEKSKSRSRMNKKASKKGGDLDNDTKSYKKEKRMHNLSISATANTNPTGDINKKTTLDEIKFNSRPGTSDSLSRW